MSALMLIHKDGFETKLVPFVYKDGAMLEAVETIADYIVGAALVDSFWEAVAADRLGIILRQQVQIRDMEEQAKAARELGVWAPMLEAVT